MPIPPQFRLKPTTMPNEPQLDPTISPPTPSSLHSSTSSLLHLMQLVSPALPVGAYSYSEGLETLVQSGNLPDAESLQRWLVQELRYGAVRLEGAVMVRVYQAAIASNPSNLNYWNQWLSAFRETEELRQQSWQMGRSLSRLLLELQPPLEGLLQACGEPCNFAVAFAIASHSWQIDCKTMILGYLHSWSTNLVNAGVRLIPLGQTAGQRLLLELYAEIEATTSSILEMKDEDFGNCSWGVAIASMNHESLYSRLFRS
nr:urease accessory protein UreF [Leptolyngbya sp. FACHB-541]